MRNHVMIDIETLGDESYSVITSIGAVQFDIQTGEVGRTFHEFINAQSAINFGLKINVSTVMWWLGQSDVARKALTEGNARGKNLVTALTSFSDWMKVLDAPINNVFVWGRGPRFDMGILADAYRKTNLDIPWDTRKELCVRTMEYLNPTAKMLTPLVDTGHGSDGMGEHDAVKDCLFQIRYVSKIYQANNFRNLLKSTT